MAQIRNGIKKILEIPFLYSTFQNCLGAKRMRSEIVLKYLDLSPGMSILDVGCGPADFLEFFPDDLTYVGFDSEASYIEKARTKFGKRGTFICEDVTRFNFEGRKFDRILISGLLHHLEDHEIEILFKTLCSLLSNEGFLLCIENTYVEEQSKVARFIISQDRGQNVRTPNGYVNICNKFFKKVSYKLRHDLLIIPYTHILIRCENL